MHFLEISDHSAEQLRALLVLASRLKAENYREKLLAGRLLGLIFDWPSTRTRLSFAAAIHRLGGSSVALDPATSMLGRGESPADTAAVMARMVDVMAVRTPGAARLQEFADAARVPVINALTKRSHPCQILADLLTYQEQGGQLAGANIAYFGDGANNIARSWIEAATLFGVRLSIAAPKSHQPEPTVMAWAQERGGQIVVTEDADAAATGAQALMTDTWASLGDDEGEESQNHPLKPYQVDARRLALAAPGAFFMHCLPAYRGYEVTAEVIDGPASRVFDQAENRLHVQAALLCWLLGASL